MKHSAYVGLVALILLGAFPILADPGTLAAQAPELQGGVRGHVASDAGGPIGGAWVNAADAGGNVVNSAITSADGAYDLSSLPPGSYQLTASARGHKDGNASVLVSGAVPVEKDFKLVHTGPVISGSVTDGKTGRGVANATVEASWSFSCKYDQPCPMMGTAAPSGGTSMMQPMPTSTATKSDGSYVIAVEAGHYSLRAFKDNYRDAYGEVEAQGATQMDFKLVPLSAKNSALEGRVLDAKSGKAIPNAWVNAYPYQAPPPMGDCPPNAACATDASGAPAPAMMPCCCCDYEGNSTQADDQGHYKLGLRAGSYMVSASAQ
ncbi:MAG TPA: carboxypeptidase-like regulatory domain-containing protein, partial [Candidatus Thermoplasmatota archaeon]|nr:carboxypeptidase-like regulatory domain-containing protein [Candidatus Thermoplasmatota archaeon]